MQGVDYFCHDSPYMGPVYVLVKSKLPSMTESENNVDISTKVIPETLNSTTTEMTGAVETIHSTTKVKGFESHVRQQIILCAT